MSAHSAAVLQGPQVDMAKAGDGGEIWFFRSEFVRVIRGKLLLRYSSENHGGISVAKGGRLMPAVQLVSRFFADPAAMNF